MTFLTMFFINQQEVSFMKMFKRLFSSLLAGMLALALLTGCGGSGILNPSTPTQRVTVVERGVHALLTAAQFSTKENKAFDSAIETTVNQISASPSKFVPLDEAYEELNENFNNAVQKADPNAYGELFILSGSINPNNVVAKLKELMTALRPVSGMDTFDARIYRVANPNDLSDNAWVVFLVRHAG